MEIRKKWTEEEDNFLKQEYEKGVSVKEIAAALEKTFASTRGRIQKLGFKRPVPEWADTHKKCTVCGEIQTLDKFYKIKTGRKAGYYISMCKSCSLRKTKIYKQSLREAKNVKPRVKEEIDKDAVYEDLQKRLGNKVCSSCGVSKPRREFYLNGKHTASRCKECFDTAKKENEIKRNLKLAAQGILK